MDEIPCTRCGGTGQTSGHAQTSYGCYWGPLSCGTCKGWGVLPADFPARDAEARKLRDDRVGRDMSHREEAARLGMKAADYSRLEHPTVDREWHPTSGAPLREWIEERKREAGGQ